MWLPDATSCEIFMPALDKSLKTLEIKLQYTYLDVFTLFVFTWNIQNGNVDGSYL